MVRGANLKTQDVPRDLWLKLELRGDGADLNAEMTRDGVVIGTYLTERFNDVIGGCKTLFMLHPDGIFIQAHGSYKKKIGTDEITELYKTEVIDGKWCRKSTTGVWAPLQRILGETEHVHTDASLTMK